MADGGGYLHALAEGGGSGAGSGEGGESPEGTDRPAGEFLWQVRGRGGFTASPTVADGIVYATVPRGVVYAFDAADGAEHWRTGVGHGVTGAPAVAGGTAYVGALDRHRHAIAVEDGSVRWTVPTGGVPKSPAVAGESVYVATEEQEVLAVGQWPTATGRDGLRRTTLDPGPPDPP